MVNRYERTSGAVGAMRRGTRAAVAALFIATAASLPGCAVAHLMGAMMQNEEYQKLVETPAQYAELEGKRVAVIVDADLSVISIYPRLVEQVTGGVTLRLARDVEGVQMIHPGQILEWQWTTPQWNAMPYGEIAESLQADRVVFIDMSEYRLHPPGDRWIWEGVAAANVSVIERDAFDPDMLVETFDVLSEFPPVDHLDRQSANAAQIERGLLTEFIKETAWLFHTHLEPKYPDKYRPELATAKMKEKMNRR